jgi:hypothetical protein
MLDSAEEEEKQWRGMIKSASATLQKEFFDGVMADGEISGINEICTAESKQEELGSGSGLAVLASSSNSETFIKSIFDLLPEVKGDNRVFYMDPLMVNLIDFAAIKAGIVVFDSTQAAFGPNIRSIKGVPILETSEDASYNRILGFDETSSDATKSDCGSLYLVNLSAEEGVTFVGQGTGDIVDFSIREPVRSGSQYNFLMEVALGLASKRTDAAYRLKGIRNATS